MSIRLLPAGPEHLDELARGLASAGLPGGDVRLPGRWFFRAVDADGPVGFGGLEGEGPDVLLRSVLIHPGARETAPAAIAATAQFARLCPASAGYLVKTLAGA